MIGIAILGFGVVGSGVADMLFTNGDLIAQSAGEEIKLLRVVDIRDIEAPDGVIVTKSFDDVLAIPEIRIVVETIGGTRAAYDYTKRALESGRHVITSNKELVSSMGDELLKIAREHNAMYLFEASVGGGIPVLHPIERCLSGNRITEINGIVNGTANYMLTRMATSGVSFPAALGEAKALGYAEENPDNDIEGWDSRRKLAILAHLCFGSKLAEEAVIPTVGISSITEGETEAAGAFGRTIKLIAHAEREGDHWYGWVNPAAVDKGHPLSAVSQVFNGIMVHGDFVGDVMFYGRGAGSHPTASAVVGDIIDVAQNINHSKPHYAPSGKPSFAVDSNRPAQYIVRIVCNDAVLKEAEALLPGLQIRAISGAHALLTPVMPQAELEKALHTLSAKGATMGVLLRVIG